MLTSVHKALVATVATQSVLRLFQSRSIHRRRRTILCRLTLPQHQLAAASTYCYYCYRLRVCPVTPAAADGGGEGKEGGVWCVGDGGGGVGL